MKATEAQRISEQNEIPLDKLYEQIESNAKYGNRSITFFDYVSTEKIAQLISDGYKISTFTDPVGMSGTKVEW